MGTVDARTQWENAAPGWARWETAIAGFMEPATEALLAMARIDRGLRVLDLACGAGSQTLSAARRVGSQGHVVAIDIAETMLRHVRENARAAGLSNITTMGCAAEELEAAAGSFDAAICRLGLMLFGDPAKALRAVRHALRPGGRLTVVVFTTPAANAFMSQTMQVLLRHAGKTAPAPGQPGLFALGATGVLDHLFAECGFEEVDQRTMTVALRMPSAAQTLTMMQEAFGAYRAVLSDCPEVVRVAAWAEVAETLKDFESETGFEASGEVLVAAGTKPAGQTG